MKKVWKIFGAVFAVIFAVNVCFDSKAVNQNLEDGTYLVEVSLNGGSGRASITSPTELLVEEGEMTAQIIFSSPNYDYMRVGEVQYFPVNEQGNSTFLIPVTVLDSEMTVVADTVAMSTPHEITYGLTFHSDTIQKEGTKAGAFLRMFGWVTGIFIGFVLCIGIIFLWYRRKATWREKKED